MHGYGGDGIFGSSMVVEAVEVDIEVSMTMMQRWR